MSLSESRPVCPNCCRPMALDAPLGLCPECLLKTGFNTGTRPDFTPPPLEEIAKAFPQFEIISLIGAGGMGAVFKARQRTLDRFVALKILSMRFAGDPGFTERFNREARALARLNHPNIVAIYDFGQRTDFYYLVMEFVSGANLREVQRREWLPPKRALQIVTQICEGLQFAHDEGIVHRDIKPENILLDSKGRVKITDFGIAKIIESTPEKVGLTGARDIIGTPHYMAPEQVERPHSVDHRADIYSLGVVFYELLTGELPLGKFPPPSARVQLDVQLDDIVLRALENEPVRRYQHAADVRTAVQMAPGVLPASISKKFQQDHGSAKVFRTPILVALTIVAVAFLTILALVAASPLMFRLKRASEGDRRQSLTPPPPERITRLETNHSPAARDRLAAKPQIPLKTDSRQLSATERSEALANLRSSNLRQLGAGILAGATPTEPRGEVVQSLIPILDDPNRAVRQSATRALGVWATPEAYEPLARMLGDSEFSVRWEAIRALGQWKDSQTAAILAKHVGRGDDIFESFRALQTIGSPAEDALIGLLQNTNQDARYEACRILKETGTPKSMAALTNVTTGPDRLAAMLARDALKAIETRQKN